MALFGCANDEQFLEELEDIECRCDNLEDVKEQTEKLYLKYSDDYEVD